MMSYDSSDNIDISRSVTLNSSGNSEMNTSNSSDETTINVTNNISGSSLGIGSDIDNNGNSTSQFRHGLTKAEIRKNNKPIMEKKRRARINHCLNELKTLILDAMKKDPARHSKLEKADILEMTVKHLQDVQRQQIAFATLDPNVMHKFKTGFSDCADEVGNYIQRIDGIESGVKQRLISHLHSCINNMETSMAVGFGGSGGPAGLFNRGMKTFRGYGGLTSQDVNNNGRMQVNGVQLIPSRLPTGELALVMPNSSNLPFFPQSFTPTNCFDLGTTSRQSAFNTVTKRPMVSPPLSPVSSLSSFDDHTVDFTASRTPPPQLTQQFGVASAFGSAFPTPPSATNVGPSMGQPHQQPFVSSTTPSTGLPQHQQIEAVKRTHWEMEGGGAASVSVKREPSPLAEQPEKVRKLNRPPSPAVVGDQEAQDNMWRPW